MKDDWTPQSQEAAALGRQFREARERSKISLRKIAEEMGTSVNTVRKHECGAMPFRITELRKAAEIMKVRLHWLTQLPEG